jgi:hypothetical protein
MSSATYAGNYPNKTTYMNYHGSVMFREYRSRSGFSTYVAPGGRVLGYSTNRTNPYLKKK